MIKLWMLFWATVIAALGGLLFWRNGRKYQSNSTLWLLSKSAIEVVLLVGAAAYLPGLLIAWGVLWAVRPIQRPWVKATAGVVFGMLFGFFSNVALELLVLVGVFSIDLKTGQGERAGFLNCWKRAAGAKKQKLAAVA